MRRSTAIALVVLGGGTVAIAALSPRKCRDPLTGREIVCPSSGTSGSHGGYWGSSGTHSGSWGSSGASSAGSAAASSAARGGFGAAGAAHASGGSS